MQVPRPLAAHATARLPPRCALAVTLLTCSMPLASWAQGTDAPLPEAVPVPPLASAGTVADPPMASRDTLSPWTKGAVLGGLGLISAGIGVWAGLEAMSNARAARSHCADGIYDDVCDPVGLAMRQEARKYTGTATVGVSASIPMLIFSTWLLATAAASWEHRTTEAARVTATGRTVGLMPGGLTLSQRF